MSSVYDRDEFVCLTHIGLDRCRYIKDMINM